MSIIDKNKNVKHKFKGIGKNTFKMNELTKNCPFW